VAGVVGVAGVVDVAGVVGVVATRPILWSLALGVLARFGCMLLNSCD